MNKFIKFMKELNKFSTINPVIHLSPATGYRARSEFGISNYSYTMIVKGEKVYMDYSDIPHQSIQETMSNLLIKIKSSEMMSRKLFQINFRTSGSEVMASLIYHKEIDANWALEAKNTLKGFSNLSLIGRSKNKKIILGNEDLLLSYKFGKFIFKIFQNDQVFFQPNFYMYPIMISFIKNQLNQPKDLLELYGGCGGLTLPLGFLFKKVFVTENNRHSIKLLKRSLDLNGFNNIESARMSDDETALALSNERDFRRLKNINLQSYEFSHVLVDPPRSGLSDKTIKIIKQFENIIYVSCNTETFFRDIKKINRNIKSIAIFDQFANTNHLEVICILN